MLLLGQRPLVFGEIYPVPLPRNDACANLRGALLLAGLFVSVEVFLDAGAAFGAVLAGEAVQEAGVALAAVAMAKAGLLVERILDFCGDRVRILNEGIMEELGVQAEERRGAQKSPDSNFMHTRPGLSLIAVVSLPLHFTAPRREFPVC